MNGVELSTVQGAIFKERSSTRISDIPAKKEDAESLDEFRYDASPLHLGQDVGGADLLAWIGLTPKQQRRFELSEQLAT